MVSSSGTGVWCARLRGEPGPGGRWLRRAGLLTHVGGAGRQRNILICPRGHTHGHEDPDTTNEEERLRGFSVGGYASFVPLGGSPLRGFSAPWLRIHVAADPCRCHSCDVKGLWDDCA